MPETSARFNEAAEAVKKLSKAPSNDQKLAVRVCFSRNQRRVLMKAAMQLYSLFKQAKIGDCNTECPGMMQFTVRSPFSFPGLLSW